MYEEKDGIESAVLDLSDCLGYSIFETELIEEAYMEGKSYQEFHESELEQWNELSKSEQEEMIESGETCFTSEAEYQRIGGEKVASQKVPEHIKHADIPYRPVLARLLKTVHDKSERIKHLDYFYRNFNACADK